MGTLYISDFKFGVDRRRLRVSSVPGTLWSANNCVITRGGEVEAAKAFVPTFSLPPGQTFGLCELRGQIWTFGSVAPPTMPPGINYQQLTAPSTAPMTQVLDASAVGGQLYVIAQFADGNVFHYYQGARITDWDTVASNGMTFTSLADWLGNLINNDPAVSAVGVFNQIVITARVPGTAFTYSGTATDLGGINDQSISWTVNQANVVGVTAAQATTTITVQSGSHGQVSTLTANRVALIGAPVPWAGSTTNMASAIAAAITQLTSTHGYTALATASTILLTAAPGTGATPNNYQILSTVTGDVAVTAPPLAGGVAAVAPVAQVVTATFYGTPQGADVFTILINGTPYVATGNASATGTTAFVASKRIFSTAGSLQVWSALNAPNDFHSTAPDTGTGFLNVANDAEGSERLTGTGVFLFNQMACFTRRNVRIYSLSADARNIGIVQPVNNTGTLSGRSILNYAGTDTLYLDEPGIRSLRAREYTQAAFVNDLGLPIDTLVRAQVNSLSPSVYSRAVSAVEPIDGRFWMAIGNTIYVLSYFPASQISAWSYITPGFTITDFARSFSKLYCRAGDTVYLYGGANGTTWPAAGQLVPYVETPFFSNQPPSKSYMEGYDQAATGEWQVQALVDPDNELSQINIGTIDHITYAADDIAVLGRAPYLALNLTCTSGGQATLANLAVYTGGAEPTK